MKVVFVWQVISGYMASCWRELAQREGIDLFVVARRPEGTPPKAGATGSAKGTEQLVEFKDDLMHGIDCALVTNDELSDPDTLASLVTPHNPDIVVLCGWSTPSFEPLTKHPALKGARFVMGMDTPYKGTLRQKLGGLAKKSYFQKVDHVVVAGERTHRLARTLGFDEAQLTRGVYGVDSRSFRDASDLRTRHLASGEPWPKNFLYIGRYIPVKAIDTLCDAYTRYRTQCITDGEQPWTLTTCGKGPDGERLRATEGVTDRGFTQPTELPGVLAGSGAFVIASRYEPWGTVLAEAGAAGLPIVCTEACSAHLDVVRTYYNGVVTPTDDAASFARGLRWVHDQRDRLPELGQRSIALAEPFGAEAWADRWVGVLRGLG